MKNEFINEIDELKNENRNLSKKNSKMFNDLQMIQDKFDLEFKGLKLELINLNEEIIFLKKEVSNSKEKYELKSRDLLNVSLILIYLTINIF